MPLNLFKYCYSAFVTMPVLVEQFFYEASYWNASALRAWVVSAVSTCPQFFSLMKPTEPKIATFFTVEWILCNLHKCINCCWFYKLLDLTKECLCPIGFIRLKVRWTVYKLCVGFPAVMSSRFPVATDFHYRVRNLSQVTKSPLLQTCRTFLTWWP